MNKLLKRFFMVSIFVLLGVVVWHYLNASTPIARLGAASSSKVASSKASPSKASHSKVASNTPRPHSPNEAPNAPNTSAEVPSKRVVNVIKDLAVTGKFKTVRLEKLNPPVQICIHKLSDDQWVSGAIAHGGFWEGDMVRMFQAVLRSDPDLGVLDIGANIGQYSLVAAHMGRPVLAVEARKLHVHMLYRSLHLNNFLDRVTLLHNAISDTYTHVRLGTYAKNQGGTHVLSADKVTQGAAKTKDEPVSVKDDMSATTIRLDDLASVARFSKAILKMDIEGYEDRALQYSQQLFQKVAIPFIMMEWAAMKNRPAETIEPILMRFQRDGYGVYKIRKGGRFQALDFNGWKEWGSNIVVKHKNLTSFEKF